MDYIETASKLTPEQIAVELRAKDAAIAASEKLAGQVKQLQHQLKWLQRQMFGQKSERRLLDMAEAGVEQYELDLGEEQESQEPPKAKQATVAAHTRTHIQRPDDAVLEQGLRFDDSVPVEVIDIKPEGYENNPNDFDVISVKDTYRVASRPASYVVLHYRRYTVKQKQTQAITTPQAPVSVFDKSYADVSLLAMLLIDKFQFHQPLYRQHQRLQQAGITLSRSLLSKWVLKIAHILEPIVDAQKKSILRSQVLALDETPIKSGVNKAKRKMKTAWFWPIMGDQNEIVFTLCTGDRRAHIKNLLLGFKGTLLSDGNETYRRYTLSVDDVDQGQCWVHTRRYFERAKDDTPELSQHAMALIGLLYQNEKTIKQEQLQNEGKKSYRQQHSKPIVDEFFIWCHTTLSGYTGSPSDPIVAALKYAVNREKELKLFLTKEDLSMDTNHLERSLRPIPMGRKNWLFAWSEIGAHAIGIIQSLLATCKMHGVHPYEYLVDVMQRVDQHPMKEVETLTPRLWKEHHHYERIKSDLEKCQ